MEKKKEKRDILILLSYPLFLRMSQLMALNKVCFQIMIDVEKLKLCEIMKNRKKSTKEKKEGKIRKGK